MPGIEILVDNTRFAEMLMNEMSGFIITQLFAFLWAVAGFLGGYGLYYSQRRESRKDILKSVDADISFIKADIDRRLEDFKSGTTMIHGQTKISIDFSGFEAPNWGNVQHEKYKPYAYGPKSLLDCRNQKWFFDAQTSLNNKLFDKIVAELKILPLNQFQKIQEFYRSKLNFCNLSLGHSKSYIARVELAERIHMSTGEITGVSPYSSLLYILDLLSARKTASEILSEIEMQI